MKLASLIIAIALLTVSIFGFTAMSHGTMGCDSAAAGMTTGDCPQALVSMALHHISAYASFSSVTFSSAMMLLLSLLLAYAAYSYLSRRYLPPDQDRAFSRLHIPDGGDPSLNQSRKLERWLSLFENSPSI